MKIIVCGAGQVGVNIATTLASEGNAVTVVDADLDLVKQIADSYDVQAVAGYASHPDVLERAGAENCDMLIAVTQSDEVNLTACQVGHTLFSVPTKIARVRAGSFLSSKWSSLFGPEHLPVDVVISPEREVARAISRRLEAAGASDVMTFCEDKVRVLGLRITDNCPLLNVQIDQINPLFKDLNMSVMGIVRDGEVIVPKDSDNIHVDDEVYVAADAAHVKRTLKAFGIEREDANRVLIIGGGHVGLSLAHILESEQPDIKLKLIEGNRNRAEIVSDDLKRTVVLNGDGLDRDVLMEANVAATNMVLAVTNDDETNVFCSLLAQRQGAQQSLALVNEPAYLTLVPSLGVDIVMNPRALTVSTILSHVRRGRIRSVQSVLDGAAEVIEAEALSTSNLVGKPISKLKLPGGVRIAMIYRGKDVVIPTPETAIEASDRVLVFVQKGSIRAVENLFAVRLEFF